MKIFFITLALIIIANSANARENWDFGKLEYGSKIQARPLGVKGWSCDEDGSCNFSDDMGVQYTTWENEVVIKTAVVGISDTRRLFGIDLTSDMNTILAQMSKKTGLTFHCDTHATNANIEADIHFCSAAVILGDPGVWFNIIFGTDRKLRKVEIFTHYL